MLFDSVNEKSCGTVVYRINDKGNIEYLLLHYGSDYWGFPKGHIERGETEQQAALRELEEETDITDVKVKTGFRERITYIFKKQEELIKKEVIYFLVKSNQKDVKLSDEHIGYAWLDFEKALDRVKYKNAKRLLEKAQKYLVKSQ